MLPLYLTEFHALDEDMPESDLIQIGDNIHYNRDNAYTFDGKVLFIEEEQNKALVVWADCLGQTRMMLVGMDFLTKQTAEAVAGSAVA
jgi:hypothetical protein